MAFFSRRTPQLFTKIAAVAATLRSPLLFQTVARGCLYAAIIGTFWHTFCQNNASLPNFGNVVADFRLVGRRLAFPQKIENVLIVGSEGPPPQFLPPIEGFAFSAGRGVMRPTTAQVRWGPPAGNGGGFGVLTFTHPPPRFASLARRVLLRGAGTRTRCSG